MALPKEVLNLIKLIDKEDHEKVNTVTSPKKMRLGEMFLYVYSPKFKNDEKVLPYYDTLPLIILLGKGGDRMLGINVHYIPWTWRVNLVRKMMKMVGSKKRIKYADIKKAINSAKIPEAIMYYALRTYLYSHIRSEVKNFDSQNYELALQNVMPKFVRKEDTYIYKDIMKKLYKRTGGIKKKTKSK